MKEKFPIVMGIININSDSFYAKSRETEPELVCKKGLSFLRDGASIIDLGACSTRPGSIPISCEEETTLLKESLNLLKNTLLEYLRSRSIEIGSKIEDEIENATMNEIVRDIGNERTAFRNLISIDTFRSEVVEMAYEILGEFTVNDISAGEADSKMLATVARLNLPYIAMYNTPVADACEGIYNGNTKINCKGITGYTPKSYKEPKDDIVEKTFNFFKEFEIKAKRAGIKEWILDPGFGFGKTLEQNYLLLKELERFRDFRVPILVGISRKSMIYKLLNTTPEDSLNATTAINFYALTKGADILRVHDIVPAVQCIKMFKKCGK